jgi:hypothetical protein
MTARGRGIELADVYFVLIVRISHNTVILSTSESYRTPDERES